ncbi:MAG TPA: DedA family protein [Rhizorhapis sp.]
MADWIARQMQEMGYIGIALLMFLENLFPPIPSEVIMPMAGMAVANGDLNMAGVIGAGTAGTLAGALFWYGLARRLGLERLTRWARVHGRWIALAEDDIEKLNRWFAAHCQWAVPLGHVIPGIRTFVSIPAGIFKMPLLRFILLTLIGAGSWTAALAIGGYALGGFEQIDRYIGPATTVIISALLGWYIFRVVTFSKQ